MESQAQMGQDLGHSARLSIVLCWLVALQEICLSCFVFLFCLLLYGRNLLKVALPVVLLSVDTNLLFSALLIIRMFI
jgi:hypothetical protein